MMRFFFALLFCSSLYAADIYLDVNASGANDGSSWTDAYTSATTATAALSNGDTLWINSGTYNAAMSITNQSNITVNMKTDISSVAEFDNAHFYNCDNLDVNGSVGGTRYLKFTDIDGTYDHVMNIRQSIPVSIEGCILDRGATYTSDTGQQHGIRIWDTTGDVEIVNCEIKNTTGDGINISQADNTGKAAGQLDWFLVDSCTITNIGDDAVQGSVVSITIRDSTLDKNGFATYFGGHPDGFQGQSGNLGDSGDYAIYRNYIKGFNQNIFFEFVKDDVYAYNNILIGSDTMGDLSRAFNISSHASFSGNFVIANNTCYDFLDFGAINGGAPAGADIENNIFVNCKYITVSPTDETIITANNIWFNEVGVQYYDSGGSPVSTPFDQRDGSGVNQDPGMTDAPNGDFTIGASSNALDAGTDMSSFFTTDYLGNTRTGMGNAYDVGAYEYQGAASPSLRKSRAVSSRQSLITIP